MTFVNAKPHVSVKKGDGPRITASASTLANGASKITFMLNKPALDLYFGGAQHGEKFVIQYGTSDDKGLALIKRHHTGDVELRKYGQKGACSLSVAAWHGVMNRNTKSEVCTIQTSTDDGVVVKLPSFEVLK